VRIGVLDLNGFALGPAIGLRDLGHVVDYVPAEPAAEGSRTDELKRELLLGVFGRERGTLDPGADLLVLSDSFADQLWALEQGIQLQAPLDPARPLAESINPLAHDLRLPLFRELAGRARRLAVLDGSDRPAPRSVQVERLAGAALLAREVPLAEAERAWRPYPFLYNMLMLVVERCRPREHWFLPFERRRYLWDWFFGGTIDHPRYGGKRAAWIEELRRAWPAARGRLVQDGSGFKGILAQAQASLWGLDLPGNGELCFRLHEYLALGIPFLRPLPWGIVVAPEVASVCRPEPDPRGRPSGGSVLAVYEQAYCPRAAAQALLAAVGAL